MTWYRSGMTVPLTLAILLLGALVALLAWLLVRAERRVAALTDRLMEVSAEYSEHSIKAAGDMARNLPKNTEKMLDTLARSINDVTAGISASVQSVYGPVRGIVDRPEGSMDGDIITPWYTSEGSLDLTDPTDALLGGMRDPGNMDADNGHGGNLIIDDDDEPFGIPGLKVEAH